MWASFRGACAAREPGIHTPGAVVMGSGLAASDLGFTRDRHWIMRTSATADVRWRPGTTSCAVGLPANPELPRDPFKDRRSICLDIAGLNRAHPVVPRLEPRSFAPPGLGRLRAFPAGHEIDHGAQWERHDINNMRPNRDLALEAAGGEAAILGERLPQGPLCVGRIAAQQARKAAHRP